MRKAPAILGLVLLGCAHGGVEAQREDQRREAAKINEENFKKTQAIIDGLRRDGHTEDADRLQKGLEDARRQSEILTKP